MDTPDSDHIVPSSMRTGFVLSVEEDVCQAWSAGQAISARFAPLFPSPRRERVAPGHLIAIATSPTRVDLIVWRWFDTVILGSDDSGAVRLWEPGHGEVLAAPRKTYSPQVPGSRAFSSAGLPGAEWWVAGRVTARPEDAEVELDAVETLFTANGLWAAAFGLAT